MKSKTGLWREVLSAIRRIVKREEELTSATLAKEFGFEVKTASAWMSILARYRYVRKIGRVPANKRWSYVWELTKFGHEYQKAAKRTKAAKPSSLRIAANPEAED